MTQSRKIVNFVSQVLGKNYHEANKYLHSLVEANLKSKIAKAVKNTKLF